MLFRSNTVLLKWYFVSFHTYYLSYLLFISKEIKYNTLFINFLTITNQNANTQNLQGIWISDVIWNPVYFCLENNLIVNWGDHDVAVLNYLSMKLHNIFAAIKHQIKLRYLLRCVGAFDNVYWFWQDFPGFESGVWLLGLHCNLGKLLSSTCALSPGRGLKWVLDS